MRKNKVYITIHTTILCYSQCS